jgi:hypothetical protein
MQLRALGGQPDQDDMLWELHALGDRRWGLVLGEGQDSIFSGGDEVVCRITGPDRCHLCIEPLGSVSKVEMGTPMALIYKVLFPSLSTFETPPSLTRGCRFRIHSSSDAQFICTVHGNLIAWTQIAKDFNQVFSVVAH